jgi:hypothetical protein
VYADQAAALSDWWSPDAVASGTNTAGTPAAASSASVTAPAALIARSARRYAAATSSR